MANDKQQIEQLQARIRELEAREATMKQAGDLVCKVSEKGAVSVYGLQRFPITLYWQQWARLIKAMPAITAFIAAHKSQLATKPEREHKPAAPAQTGPTAETQAALAVVDRVLGPSA